MPNITIRELPPVILPIDTPTTFLEVSVLEAGKEVSRRVAADDLQTAIGLDASFVTVGLNAALPNERVLTGSVNISVTDNGAGSTIVLDVIGPALEPEQLFESGVVVLNTRAQGVVGLRSDIVGTSPPAPADNPTAILDFYNITGVTRTGRVGYNGIGGNLDIFNEVHGGDVVLAAEDAAGVSIIGLQIDPDAITTLRGDTTVNIAAEGEAVPFAIFGNDAGSGSPVRRLVLRDFDTDGVMNYGIEFQEADFTPTGFIGYGFGVLTQLQVGNRFNDGQLRLSITDGGGIVRNVMLAVPASNLVSLYDGSQNNPNVNIVTFANGSLEARNEVTGPASTERVMTGADRAALVESWEFDVSVDTSTDPGTNDFRMNNVDPSLVTEIAVDDLMLSQIGDFGDFFGPELASGDKIFIKQNNDGTRWATYVLTGPPVDATGFWQIPVTADAQGVIFTNFQECSFEFTVASAGFASVEAAFDQFNYQFDTATAQADPGPGFLRLNNATPSSATFAYVDDLDVGGIDIGSLTIANLVAGNKFRIRNPADLTSQLNYRLTGIAVDFTGFWRIPITFEDGDNVLPGANDNIQVFYDPSVFIDVGTEVAGQSAMLYWNNDHWDSTVGSLTFNFSSPPVGGRIRVAGAGTVDARRSALFMTTGNSTSTLWFVEGSTTDEGFFAQHIGSAGVEQLIWGWDTPGGGQQNIFGMDESLNFNLFQPTIFTGAPGVIVSNAVASIGIRETGATADEGNWILRADGDLFRLQTANDAAPNTAVENAISVIRTGTVVDQVDMGAPVTADSNFLLEGYTTGKSVLRSIRFIAAPGATPNTNMDVTNNNSGRSYNAPSITDATDLAVSGSSGSWSLDATGEILTLDITEDIVGILGIDASIVVDINSSTQTEMYFVDPRISGTSVTFFIFRRGTSAAVSWLSILDAGDQWHIQFQFVTSS